MTAARAITLAKWFLGGALTGTATGILVFAIERYLA
jgi:hypothetical protein